MFDLRDMELLAALAHHGHFARAAEACGISQPAFSARIRNLEAALGVAVVRRGNRFQGFTAEGEIALRWARQMLSQAEGMRQDISAAMGRLAGRLVVGVVPTALAVVARVPALVAGGHPNLAVEILSMTSAEVVSGLTDHRLDLGVTYLRGPLPAVLSAEPLYRERYALLAPDAMVGAGETLTWRAAARLPLCLLSRNMQNRAILDEAFAGVGASPNPVVETNALTASLVQVQTGRAATIVPEMLLDGLPLMPRTRVLRLVDPVLDRPMGILRNTKSAQIPSIQIFENALKSTVR